MIADFSPWYGLVGGGILLLTLVDLGVTILRLDGPGPITGRLSLLLWRILLEGRKRRWIGHRQLSYASPCLLLMFLGLWCGLTWLGWTLIFESSSSALVANGTLQPVPPLGRCYFVGQTLSTLGVSEIQPVGFGWRSAATLCGLNGFFLLTLTVTYLLPLYDAAGSKRTVGNLVSALGCSPEEILEGKWSETEFHQALLGITERLTRVSVIHRAYPMLHFFHSARPEASLSLQVAVLDEALTLWECGSQPAQRLPRTVHDPLRKAIFEFIQTVSPVTTAREEDIPLPRPLSTLQKLGMATVTAAEYHHALQQLDERRSQLKDMVEGHGWSWKYLDSREASVPSGEAFALKDGSEALRQAARGERSGKGRGAPA